MCVHLSFHVTRERDRILSGEKEREVESERKKQRKREKIVASIRKLFREKEFGKEGKLKRRGKN